MSQWSRILIPAGLGGLAFMINAWTISQAISPRSYTIVASDIVRGSTVTASDLKEIRVSGNHDQLKTIWLPWEERSIILGTQIRRPLQSGDPVMRIDIDWNENQLGPNDVQVTVPMGSGAFEPSLVNPGDYVNFILELNRDTEMKPLGPFRVVAIGARTKSFSDKGNSHRASSMTVAVPRNSELHQSLQSVISYASVRSVERLPFVEQGEQPRS